MQREVCCGRSDPSTECVSFHSLSLWWGMTSDTINHNHTYAHARGNHCGCLCLLHKSIRPEPCVLGVWVSAAALGNSQMVCGDQGWGYCYSAALPAVYPRYSFVRVLRVSERM